MSKAYYNEIDPYCAIWLKNLMDYDLIADGDIDTRSIEDVTPNDLKGYTQCHFFTGIGVWSHALRLAGWPDGRAVWTGSCPCQPFSAAGKGGGFADERHLWPAWHHLIRECRPDVVFGEQVASKDGLAWLELVHADLEATGYAVGAFDLCAASVGAPHIRQRLYFVADSNNKRLLGQRLRLQERQGPSERVQSASAGSGAIRGGAGSQRQPGSGMGHANSADVQRHDGEQPRAQNSGGHQPDSNDAASASRANELADTDGRHASAERLQRSGQHGQQSQDSSADRLEHVVQFGRQRRETPSGRHDNDGSTSEWEENQHGACVASTHWSDCDWLPCTDGKARPVEPGTFPLAHGAPARVGRLRAYGNAIVAPLAKEFIAAYMETVDG